MSIEGFIREWRGDRRSLLQHLDIVLGPQSRARIERDYAEQIRDVAEVREMLVRKLHVEADGRDRYADLHPWTPLCHETESADGNDNDRNQGPSAQMERVPRMDENEKPVDEPQSDAESLARTLDRAAVTRRAKRKMLLAEIAARQQEIADLDHVIKELEKTTRRLLK